MAPPPKFKVLFICTGNACRSVMAEQWLNRLAAERGLGLEARSCGIAAERYFAVPDPVRALLGEAGIKELSHVPRLVTRDLLRWSDVALAMTRAQKEHVLDRFPEFTGKVFALRPYLGGGDGDVEDPLGGSDEAFAACWRELRELVELLIGREIPGRSGAAAREDI